MAGQMVHAETLADLGKDVWTWRAQTQPSTGDDVPRIIRPKGWVPDWSPAAVSIRYERLAAFEKRWKVLAPMAHTAVEQTDYRLVGSALARVRWELDHVAAWKRQPHFYIAQTLTPIFEVLLPPPPVERDRITDVLRLVRHIPQTLDVARRNLTDRRGPFVEIALKQLDMVPASLRDMAKGLEIPVAQRVALDKAVKRAIEAFGGFRRFLEANREGLDQRISVGRESYAYFLKEVALYPYSPEDLLLMGEQEWARTAAFEAFEQNRNQGLAELPIGPTIQDVVTRLDDDEQKVRAFLQEKQILTLPDWVGHYYAQPFPDYLRPMAWLGRTFDLTNADRRGQNATVYLPDPSPIHGESIFTRYRSGFSTV